MAKNWEYVELTKAVKVAGGPEKYVEKLKETSRHMTKMEILPWIGVTACCSSLLTITIIKSLDYFKSKKKQ